MSIIRKWQTKCKIFEKGKLCVFVRLLKFFNKDFQFQFKFFLASTLRKYKKFESFFVLQMKYSVSSNWLPKLHLLADFWSDKNATNRVREGFFSDVQQKRTYQWYVIIRSHSRTNFVKRSVYGKYKLIGLQRNHSPAWVMWNPASVGVKTLAAIFLA